MKPNNWRCFLGLLMLALPATLLAHTGHGVEPGFAHPLTGLDHMIAALAVGLWAVQSNQGLTWKLPTAYMAATTVGLALAFAGLGWSGFAVFVPVSILIFGGMLLWGQHPRLPLALCMASGFALFHGLIHGAEIVGRADLMPQSIGFLMSTALLHVTGIGMGVLAQRSCRLEFLRPAGAALVVCGLVFMVL